MKIRLDCYPCLLRRALSAARRAGADAEHQRQVLPQTMDHLRSPRGAASPPQMAEEIHRLVRSRTHSADPYVASHRRCRQHHDYGAAERFDLETTLECVLVQPFAIDDLARLRGALAAADSIFDLADNAGETVFDRAWIQYLSRPVTYPIKGHRSSTTPHGKTLSPPG
jgi:uncharacterized protein with ATP-grasp and redox domains